jgi:hypothetical protein
MREKWERSRLENIGGSGGNTLQSSSKITTIRNLYGFLNYFKNLLKIKNNNFLCRYYLSKTRDYKG